MKPGCRVVVVSLLAFCMRVPSPFRRSGTKSPTPSRAEKTRRAFKPFAVGQTQTLTDTSQMTGQGRADSGQSRVQDVFKIHLRIRFLSAKPVRQAISHLMELTNREKISAQLAERLKAFAAADFPDYIVITVTSESDKASRLLQETQASFYKLTTTDLKNNTYLLAGGRRVFLKEYQPPGNDGPARDILSKDA